MDLEVICKKIFNLALPYATMSDAPVSYVNLEIGFDSEFQEEELWKCFNKLRWDSSLASAELFITRKPYTGERDSSVKIVSLSVFEDDEGFAPLIPIKDGVIL